MPYHEDKLYGNSDSGTYNVWGYKLYSVSSGNGKVTLECVRDNSASQFELLMQGANATPVQAILVDGSSIALNLDTKIGTLTGSDPRLVQASTAGTLSAALSISTLRRVLWTKTASTTVANSVAETTLFDTGVGSKTLAVNTLSIGRTIPFECRGYLSTTGTPTLRLKLKFGSVVLLDSTAVTMGAGVTNKQFIFRGTVTARTTGGSGTVFAQGDLEIDGLATTYMTNTTTITIDTTATQAIDLTATWGTADAANTVTASNSQIEAMG